MHTHTNIAHTQTHTKKQKYTHVFKYKNGANHLSTISPLSPLTHTPIFFFHTYFFYSHKKLSVAHTVTHTQVCPVHSRVHPHTCICIHRQSESCAKHLTSLPIYTHTYFSRTHANTYSHIYCHTHTKSLTAARTFTHIYLHTQAKSTMPNIFSTHVHIWGGYGQ